MKRFRLDSVAGYEPTEIDDQAYTAAVLVPILGTDSDAGPELLFTKRAEDLGEHPGQMSFPGGGKEPADEGYLETALRESNEEIGLQPAEATIAGRLDDIRTVTEYAVTPVVAEIPRRTYEPNEREVAEIVRVPLSALLDPTNYETERRNHPYYGDIVIPYFHVGEYTIWGATGRILVQLLELTTPFDSTERRAEQQPGDPPEHH